MALDRILFRANHFSLLQRSLSLIPHWDERPLGRRSLRLLKVTAIGSPGRHSTVTLGFKNYYMLLCYGLCLYITLDITSLSFSTKSPIKFFCQSELGEAGLKYRDVFYYGVNLTLHTPVRCRNCKITLSCSCGSASREGWMSATSSWKFLTEATVTLLVPPWRFVLENQRLIQHAWRTIELCVCWAGFFFRWRRGRNFLFNAFNYCCLSDSASITEESGIGSITQCILLAPLVRRTFRLCFLRFS